jgi:predicted dienelactone hydrolase
VPAVHHSVVRTEDPARRRPIHVDLWQSDAAGARPVILLSHGAFGAAQNYAWLAKHLAASGYVVAGLSHHGESYVYGPETIELAAALRFEQRTRDCSFVLDQLLGEARFRGVIDPARIGAIGHSSGGATVIGLAGGLFDGRAMQRYCNGEGRDVDLGCTYASQVRTPPVPPPVTSQRDARVRAVVALDPALGPGHDAASLAAITIPVHVVGAVDNDFIPFDQHAGRYARLIPGASLTRLEGGEGHFVFLNAGEKDVSIYGVALYRDRPGVDRAEVHARLAEVIRRFFDAHLAA